MVHPYYQIAHLYNPVSSSSPVPTLVHSTVTTDTGRAGIGEYYKLSGTRSWIDPTASHPEKDLCIQKPLAECPDGFALSFWAYLDKTSRATAPATLYNSGTHYDEDHVHVAVVLTPNKIIAFRGKLLKV